MREEIKGFSDVQVEIVNITIDTQKREAVVRSSHTCTMAADQRVWEFEFMFILKCGEYGRSIKEIVQFVDTATAHEMMVVYKS